MDSAENKNQIPASQNSWSLSTIAAFFWDLIKITAIALIIIIPFRKLVAEPFVVSGSSMLPNFYNKDYLIIDRLSYHTNLPARGDVVVLKFPKDTSQYFIKRVIGLPGEKVKLSQGQVIIFNQEHPEGWRIKESYLIDQTQTLGRPDEIILGSNEYFVLGDNRTASSDSRVWGILPASDIVGKVWLRVFPVGRFGLFERPSYQQAARSK